MQVIGEINSDELLTILESEDFRSKLDHVWSRSYQTGNEHGFAVFHGLVTASSDIIEGTNLDMNVNVGKLILEAPDNAGPMYLFLHSHPSKGCLLPTPEDLDLLSHIRAQYQKHMGFHFRPIHGVCRYDEYSDRNSLRLLLYQEKTENPLFEMSEDADNTTDLLLTLYAMASGHVPKCRKLTDVEVATILNDLEQYNASLITYHKDNRVDKLPYVVSGKEGLERFDQLILYDRRLEA